MVSISIAVVLCAIIARLTIFELVDRKIGDLLASHRELTSKIEGQAADISDMADALHKQVGEAKIELAAIASTISLPSEAFEDRLKKLEVRFTNQSAFK